MESIAIVLLKIRYKEEWANNWRVFQLTTARCSEWHAELTRDELLQSMDMEEPSIVREGSNKNGKKKKSKRSSRRGRTSTVQPLQEQESGLHITSVDELSSGQVLEEDLKHVDKPLQEELDSMKCEYYPSVGIIDGKQVIAAEMYLVQRLQVIVGLEGIDSTPSTKRVPIVWMWPCSN